MNILSDEEVERIKWRFESSGEVSRLCESHRNLKAELEKYSKHIEQLRDECERLRQKLLERNYNG